MFANILASVPAGVLLGVASTTLLGLAGVGVRCFRIASDERKYMRTLETGEKIHGQETLKEMHYNLLTTQSGMHANQVDAELEAVRLKEQTEQIQAVFLRTIDPSFALSPQERSNSLEVAGRTKRQGSYDRVIVDLPDLLRVIEN
jgi:ABC-type transport system involved in cytochrome bd biosynthesis fused ATPase/permease subunit